MIAWVIAYDMWKGRLSGICCVETKGSGYNPCNMIEDRFLPVLYHGAKLPGIYAYGFGQTLGSVCIWLIV